MLGKIIKKNIKKLELKIKPLCAFLHKSVSLVGCGVFSDLLEGVCMTVPGTAVAIAPLPRSGGGKKAPRLQRSPPGGLREGEQVSSPVPSTSSALRRVHRPGFQVSLPVRA